MRLRRSLLRSSRLGGSVLVSLVASVLAACGGKVVFVEEGGGGSGGDGGAGGGPGVTVGTTTSSSSSSSSSSTGVGGGGPGLVEEPVAEDVKDGVFAANVTPTTLGITMTATTVSDFGELTFSSLTAPSGALVVDGFLPSNTASWSWYGSVAMATPQVSHPETFPLAQGAWQFGLSASSPADVSLWRRSTVDGAFHGGVIDLNVFIADDIVDQDYVLEVASNAYADWGGLELGDVRFFDIGAEFVSVDENNVFALLDQTADMPTRPALNIMAVGSIGGAFEGAAGFSLGIPGNPMAPGSTQSAVVWMVLSDEFYDPIILRHEAGHFGGLFHTSEFQAGLVDPLDDTPGCDDVLAQFESCPDYDYIMFPSGGSGAGLFSPLESKVLQAGALYRGVFAPGEPPMTPYGPPLEGDAKSFRAIASLADKAWAQQAAAVSRARGAKRARGAWASGWSSSTAAHLEGIGCPPGGAGESSFFDELEGLSAAGTGSPLDVHALLALGSDASAPAYVRRRALVMAGRLAARGDGDATQVGGALEALARSASTPEHARVGALRGLFDLDRGAGLRVARSLDGDAGRTVAAVARSLR